MTNQDIQIEEGWFVFIIRLILRIGFCGGLLFIIVAMLRESSPDQIKNFCKQFYKKGSCIIAVCMMQGSKWIKQQYKLDFFNQENIPEEGDKSNLLAPLTRTHIYRFTAALLIEGFLAIFRILKSGVNQLVQFCGYLKRELVELINPANKNIQSRLFCPLSKVRFSQPVLLNQCGHTFQKSNIEYYLTKNTKCPICETPAKRINIKKNFILENILRAIAQQKPAQITRKNKNSSGSNNWSFALLILILFLIFYLQPQPQPQQTSVKDVLTKTYNIVHKDLMSVEEYKKNKAQFIQLFNSPEGSSKLTITKNKKFYYSKVSVDIVKQGKFLTELRITGEAEKGGWTGQGYLMPRNNGLYFWMVVTESKKQHNAQLIYQSYIMSVPVNEISGKWYYLGHITDRDLSGEWQISTSIPMIETVSHPVPEPVKIQTSETIENLNNEI